MKITIKVLDRYIAGELNQKENELIEQKLLEDEKLLRLFHLMVNIDEAIGSMDEIEMRQSLQELMKSRGTWPGSRKKKVSP